MNVFTITTKTEITQTQQDDLLKHVDIFRVRIIKTKIKNWRPYHYSEIVTTVSSFAHIEAKFKYANIEWLDCSFQPDVTLEDIINVKGEI